MKECIPVEVTQKAGGITIGTIITPGLHDWRLWERERRVTEGAPRPLEYWREVWYCTKCRQLDEREVYDAQ